MSDAQSSRRPRVVPAAFLVLLLSVALSACGSGSGSSSAVALTPGASGAVTSPKAGGAVKCQEVSGAVSGGSTPMGYAVPTITTSAPVIGRLGGTELLPTDFPVPPGAIVGQVSRVDPVAITVPLTLSDIEMAYDYLKIALPQHGYTITSCSLTPGLAAIGFHGHECVGADTQAVFATVSSSVVCALS